MLIAIQRQIYQERQKTGKIKNNNIEREREREREKESNSIVRNGKRFFRIKFSWKSFTGI